MNHCSNHISYLLKRTSAICRKSILLLFLLQLILLDSSAQMLNSRQLDDGRLETIFMAYPIKGTDNIMNGSLYLSKSWTVNQFITSTATAVPAGQPDASYRNMIMFSLDEDYTSYIPSDFTATVTVDIAYKTASGSQTYNLNNQILTIDYKKDKGTRSDVKQYIAFEGANEVTVTVKSFSFPALSGIDLKNLLVLTNEVRQIRFYNATGSMTGLATNIPPGGVKDELPVQWSVPVNGAFSGIQLEWAWLENELEDNYFIEELGFVPVSYLSRTQTTRVDLPVSATSYNIPLLYSGTGKVHFRIRGTSINEFGNIVYGEWTNPVSFSYEGHEPSLNWQSMSSFAEDGKRKTVIEYFDGSLRARQAVTKDNTTNKTVTSETMYDSEGRPAISILPAPGVNDYISFNKNLNLFTGQTPDTQNPAELFDLQPLNSKGNSTPSLLNTIAGSASQYYSTQNPEKAIEKALPDAEGYPYSVTRYTADATGRILSQNNVGGALNMSATRNVKYFYGSATQEELDGLFGTDVGDKSHYSKNMVKDENGQMSVSYVDMHGRTIATALTGDAPNTMQALAIANGTFYPNQNNRPAIVSNLINGENGINNNGKFETVSSLFVTVPQTYTLAYQLNPPVITLPTCENGINVCYTSMFDLEISISEESSDSLPIIRTYRYSNVKDALDTSCATINRGFYSLDNPSLPADTIINIQEALKIGAYSIRKTLSLNQEAFERVKADYLQRGVCVDEQELRDSIYNVLRLVSGCDDPTPVPLEDKCNECLNELGTEAEFIDDYLFRMGLDLDFEANPEDVRYEIKLAYKKALDNCNLLCGIKNSTIEKIRQQMLMDMYPVTGQYARGVPGSGGLNPIYIMHDVLHSFNVGFTMFSRFKSPIVYDFGTYSDYYRTPSGAVDLSIHPPGDISNALLMTMTKEEFAKVFKGSWANALLPYHPEYHRLIYAENTLDKVYNVYNWQKIFEAKTTYAEAQTAGYIYTTSNGFNDPLMNMEIGTRVAMYGLISNGNTETNGYSLWQLAYIQTKCGSVANGNPADCNLPTGFQQNAKLPTHSYYTSLSVPEKDRLWNAFKSIYINYRNDLINKLVTSKYPLFNGNYQMFADNGYRLHFAPSIASQINYIAKEDANNPESGNVWAQINNLVVNPTGSLPNTWKDSAALSSKNSNCDALIEEWRRWLLQCPAIQNHASSTTILNTILNQMRNHCRNTVNDANPYGASTHPSTSAGFEQIITNVLNTYSIAWSDVCNPYVIEFPKPYGNNKATALTIKSELLQCDCDQFALIKADAIAEGYNPANRTNLNQYLRNKFNDTLSVAAFNGYNECNTLGSLISTNCYVIGYQTITHPCDVNPCDLDVGDPMFVNNLSQMLGVVQPMSIPEIPCEVHPWGPMPGVPPIDCNDMCTTSCPITECVPVYKTSIKLAEPVRLPSVFNCGSSLDICLNCTEFKTLVTEFKTKFNNTPYVTAPHFLTGESLTNVEVAANNLLAKFINFRTGFQYNWNEYSTAMQNAGCLGETVTQIAASDFNNSQTDGWQTYGGATALQVEQNMLRATVTEANQGVQKTFAVEAGKRYRVRADLQAGSFSLRIGARLLNTNSITNIDSLTFNTNNGGTAKFDFYPFEDSITFQVNAFRTYNDSHSSGPKYVYLDYFVLEEVQIDTLVANDNVILCQNSYVLSDASEVINSQDPCLANYFESVEVAIEISKTRTETILANFDSHYMTAVRNTGPREKFTVSYVPKEYHYTLYYYDQAGNLVKTIPPRGVIPNYTPTELEAVATARKNNVHRPRAHTHATHYRYNSLNQVVQKENADEGLGKYWYDQLGRLVLSQNANQTGTKYSYTLYDAFSRITEVGQLTNATAMTHVISRNPSQLESWINAASTKEQITYTYYDQPYSVIMGGSGEASVSAELTQQNLRKRVSYTAVKENVSDVHYDAATFYSYDIHGNVKNLTHDFRKITAGSTTARFKKMVYSYDLISGNVNEVAYQPGAADAFYHRYQYDAENRLTDVFTSRTGWYWERDASYTYYRHGPLRRMIIGQQQVQAVDYAYTLQGWIKGVNSTLLTPAADIGQDGHTTGANRHVARDVYSFGLHYYDAQQFQDYKNIDGTSAFARANPGVFSFRSLFNGNIAGMSVNLGALNSAPDMSKINSIPLFYRYNYDQLNRIVISQPFSGLQANNTWAPVSLVDYRENIAYNPNGNITTLNRMGAPSIGMPTFMDRMTYQYYPGNGNRLRNVVDTVAAGNYEEDIDTQPVGYYVYDAIGNLIKEGTTDISWNIYGKIKSIQKSDTAINYSYDPTGNRISKKVGNDITLYVRDASGNVMSVYDIGSSLPVQKEVHLYGSSRLGINTDLTKPVSEKTMTGVAGGKGIIHTFTRGEKFFELSNHLGNVLASVSDKKIAVSGSGFSATISHFEADVVSASDYSPFGMQLVGRNFSTQKYRYGFNGKENDNEVKGNGNQQDYGMRIYDPRLGRFLSVDPLAHVYPWNSPYAFAENDVIRSIDLDGLEKYIVNTRFDEQKRIASITIVRYEDIAGNALNFNYRSKNGSPNPGKDDQVVYRIFQNGSNKPETSFRKELTADEKEVLNDKKYFKYEYLVDENSFMGFYYNENYTSDRMPEGTVYKVSSRQFNYPAPTPPTSKSTARPPVFNNQVLKPNTTLSDFNGSSNYFYGTSSFNEGGRLGENLQGALSQLAMSLKQTSGIKSITVNILQGVNENTGSRGYNQAHQYGNNAVTNGVRLLRELLKGTGITVNVGTVTTQPNTTVPKMISSGQTPGMNITLQ